MPPMRRYGKGLGATLMPIPSEIRRRRSGTRKWTQTKLYAELKIWADDEERLYDAFEEFLKKWSILPPPDARKVKAKVGFEERIGGAIDADPI
jgi:hypothetical protein